MTMVNACNGSAGRLGTADEALIARRQNMLGPAYRLFYDQPLHPVRGEGVWLWGAGGNRYLDGYNNVVSVGHCHPHVTRAIAAQAAMLNTHTRYLHEGPVDYAERLLATTPDALGHVMFTCTGSEANDLALRITCACTGRTGIIVTRNAYHGVTEAVAELSPSLGAAFRVARGSGSSMRPAEGRIRVRGWQRVCAPSSTICAPAAFICDTIFSSDGLIPDPASFLQPTVDLIRAEGGIFIADEVQPGFARTVMLSGDFSGTTGARHGDDGQADGQ